MDLVNSNLNDEARAGYAQAWDCKCFDNMLTNLYLLAVRKTH